MEFLKKQWFLHTVHSHIIASVMTELLADISRTPVQHPAYSLNLATVIFGHFQYLNMSCEDRNSVMNPRSHWHYPRQEVWKWPAAHI
jgi:hypothetical protein